MKKYVLLSLAVVVVGILILCFIGYQTIGWDALVRTGEPMASSTQPVSAFASLEIGDTVVRAELAETPEARERGLSGRTSLPLGQGMLFVMPSSAQYRFWMPDMHFAIDMIWLNESLTVVDVTEAVSPASYPTTFTSRVPARYILEVPAGFAAAHEVGIGHQAALRP